MFCVASVTSPELTFVGTSYPLQRCDIIVVLADREGENTDLSGRTKLEPAAIVTQMQQKDIKQTIVQLSALSGGGGQTQ